MTRPVEPDNTARDLSHLGTLNARLGTAAMRAQRWARFAAVLSRALSEVLQTRTPLDAERINMLAKDLTRAATETLTPVDGSNVER